MSEDKNQPVPEEVKPPSMLTMIKTFGVELKKWVAAGSPVTTPADYIERLTACNNCPHLVKKKMRCGKCGCAVEHKAKWRTTTCPDTPQRWKPQDPTPKTTLEIAAKERDEEKQLKEQALKAKEVKVDNDGWEDIPMGPRPIQPTSTPKDDYVDFEEVKDE